MGRDNVVKDKSFEFALKIIEIYKFLIDKNEYIMSKQVLRSGTSIGAMIRESEHAESRADFIHKFAVAQKEANETDYWLDLLYSSRYIPKEIYSSMKNQLRQLQKLISSIIITTKGRKK